MRDIDLLVKRDQCDTVRRVAEQLGYRSGSRYDDGVSGHHLAPLIRDGVVFEIHWQLFAPAIAGAPDGPDTDRLIDRAEPITIASQQVLGLSPVDTLLHVAAHATHQHLCETRLSGLVDVTLIVERWQGVLEWRTVMAEAKRWGVDRGLRLALALCDRFSLLQLPAEAHAACDLSRVPEVVVEAAVSQIAQDGHLDGVGSNFDRLFDASIPARHRLALAWRRITARNEDAGMQGARHALIRPGKLLMHYGRRSLASSGRERHTARQRAHCRNVMAGWLNPLR